MIRKLTILLVVVVWIILLTTPCFANPDEVTALKAELASTKAELNKIKYANVLPIERQIKPAPQEWKDAYSDTKDTQVYFNIKAAWVQIERCNQAIRLIASTINTITDPNDPNSLTARVERIEKVVGELPSKYSNLNDPENTVIGAILLHTETISQFRDGIEANTVRIGALESLTTILDVRAGFIEDAMPHKADKRTRHQSPALKPDDSEEVAK